MTSCVQYKRHLNPKSDRLFQRPSKNASSASWYDAVPLGHNTIGNMMSGISLKAQLSRRYTNHSLRATAVHVLDSSGQFAGRHIMTVTGHKAETSLKTYTGYTDPEIKRKMSDTISKSVRVKGEVAGVKRKASISSKNAATTTRRQDDAYELAETVLEPLTHSQENTLMSDLDEQFDQEFDDMIKSMDPVNVNKPVTVSNPQVVYQPHTWQNMSYHVSRQQPLPYPVLNNCTNVTVNFNITQSK